MIEDVKEKFASRIGIAVEEAEINQHEKYRLNALGEPYYTRDRLLFIWECRHRNLSEKKGNKAFLKEIDNYIKELKSLDVEDQLYSLTYSTEFVYYFATATDEKIIFFHKLNLESENQNNLNSGLNLSL